MKTIALEGQKRTIVGRKTKNLRKQGKIPGNIFGKHVKSLAVELNADRFAQALAQAGTTGLIDLKIDGEVHPVLIKSTQQHPLTGYYLHVDLYQVDLKEKVKTEVPVEVVGTSPAVSGRLGVLLTFVSDIEVEALPMDLPEKIKVDISNLKAVGQGVKVKDLSLGSAVSITSDPELEIVKIGDLVTKEAEAQAKAEAEAAAAAAATAAATAPAPGAASTTPAAAPAAPKPEEKKA